MGVRLAMAWRKLVVRSVAVPRAGDTDRRPRDGAVCVVQYRRLRRSSQPILLGPRQAKDRPLERAVTDNFGHSAWQPPVAAAKHLFPGPHRQWGGIVVGEVRGPDPSLAGVPFDPRDRSTWGPKVGKAPLMIDPCTRGSGHSCIFAGSGAFKSSSAVCTVLTWTGSSVVIDPSTEIGAHARHRTPGAGQRGFPHRGPERRAARRNRVQRPRFHRYHAPRS